MQNIISNKKGLSDIISNVMIILLVISMSILVFSSINNILDNPALSPEYSCPNIKFKNPVLINSACYNETNEKTQLILYRQNDFAINQINFLITGNETNPNQNYYCGSSCGECNVLSSGNSEKYYLSSSFGKEVVLSVNNCAISSKKITLC